MQFPRIFSTLELSMKAANLKHQVMSNNIANFNVPDFEGSDVLFEDQLNQALTETRQTTGLQGLTPHSRHIPIPQAQTFTTIGTEPRIVPLEAQMRQDGNNIDIEDQMAKMAANQLWYQGLVRSVSDEFGRLRTAITEGRR